MHDDRQGAVEVEARTVADRIAAGLVRHGVKRIFAQSLPSAVVLACEARGVVQVSYRQENTGGVMADGHARRSGRVSVVCAQNGPAAALLVAPLAEALKASVPLVALVQEVETAQRGRNAFQDLDHTALFASCAKWLRTISAPDRIDDDLDAAFTAAASGRPGPAVLLLPADLLRATAAASPSPRRADLGRWPLDRSRPDDATVAAAASLLAEARAPVVVAGGGCHAGGGAAALAALQDAAHLPVLTTNMGKGAVDEHHALSAGVLGSLTGPGSLGRRTRALLEEADVVLLAGTRTNQNGTDSWRLPRPGTRVIHLDVDPGEPGRNYEPSVRLVGDAATTLDALREAIGRAGLDVRLAGRASAEARIAAAWVGFDADRSARTGANTGPIRPERVMAELQRLLTPETTVVADASYSSMWVVGQLRGLRAGQRFLTPRGLAGLGWGLPLAMGAKVAAPEHPVVVLVGDGGFAHAWAEMETMVRMGIHLPIIVLNNGVLGYQKDAETVKFGAYTSACHFAPVDHAALAAACGLASVRVEQPGDIGPALARALAEDRPWLIEVMTDPDAHPPISLYDGSLDKAA